MILFVWYINNNRLYENSITTQIYLFLLSDPTQLLISNHNNVRLVPMLQTTPDTIDRVTLFLSLSLDHCHSSHVIIEQSFQFLSSNSLGYSNEYTKITLLNLNLRYILLEPYINLEKRKNVDVTVCTNGFRMVGAYGPPGRHVTCSRLVSTTHGTIPAIGTP
jgi:hypothetical protein